MGCSPEQSRINGRKGGRRPGSPNVLTRRLAIRACREVGLSPLDVMLANLRHWHEQAESLEAQHADTDAREEVLFAARTRAQRCAIDAAPYCHPRVAAVRTKLESDARVEPMSKGDDLIESQRRYVEYLRLDPPPE